MNKHNSLNNFLLCDSYAPQKYNEISVAFPTSIIRNAEAML